MNSLADGLPAEIARQVHPEWHKNERDYWSVRDGLLSKYSGQWVAFANGVVVVSGIRPVSVLSDAQKVSKHPYLTCVGREEEPYRIRRATFAYDSTYAGEALPVISAEFRPHSGVAGAVLDCVIPDTGADSTALPWADCQHLQLDPTEGIPGIFGGVGGGSAATLGFLVWVFLDGSEYPCQLLADFAGHERILGRDVLNSLNVLFRGPSNEVVLNP